MWTPDDDSSQQQPGLLQMNYPNSQQWQHPSFLQSFGSYLGNRMGGGGGQQGGYGYGGTGQSAIAGPLRRKLFSGVSSFFL